MSMVVRKADEADLLEIKQLVVKAGLQASGIEENLNDFLVVETEEQEMIGTVGLECFGKQGLLRSFVIDSQKWTGQHSVAFLQLALAHAKQKQIETIYLYARQSSELFQQLGFAEVEKAAVPFLLRKAPYYQQVERGETRIFSCSL
ncbi:GNAT family N-acetyltransferase [Halalkalibacterium ligniniphilum]|uniref:GNAT family N-acetyltransferase n=1 Tax=Halalkalibacterium ligniniphilum TaxID=1134413 RepID=UPI000346DADC|nr:hypothetical protein [Halalkalibacterium ligniniphilum]